MLQTSHIIWNLFLAFIPAPLALSIGFVYRNYPRLGSRWWVWGPFGLLWLGFLPNTAYLITEWRHFIEYLVLNPVDVQSGAQHRDAIMSLLALASFYVVYSGVGLITFSMSIWPIAQLTKPPWVARAAFFYVCALGVYLGLIKRLNTWDIVYHPRHVLQASVDTIAHPLLLLLTIAFAVVLWLSYWVFEVFVDGLLYRLRLAKAGSGRPA